MASASEEDGGGHGAGVGAGLRVIQIQPRPEEGAVGAVEAHVTHCMSDGGTWEWNQHGGVTELSGILTPNT